MRLVSELPKKRLTRKKKVAKNRLIVHRELLVVKKARLSTHWEISKSSKIAHLSANKRAGTNHLEIRATENWPEFESLRKY